MGDQRQSIRRGLKVAIVASISLCCCRAQTIRPVVVEYRTAAKGKFEVVNNGLEPLTVVLQPSSFTISENGDATFSRLNPEIHVKLSAMSLRIPPLQRRFVFYQATADSLPAWFTIYSTISGHPKAAGFNIELDLPHTVYLLQKEHLEKADIEVESATYVVSTRHVSIDIVNRSRKLGRVTGWELSAKGKKVANSGFPLLPGSRRHLDVQWDSPNIPDKLSLQFDRFVIKNEIGVRQAE
jgi:hypothetical protein